jgi:ABC-type phosphate transport system ATPase subunit
MREGACPVSFLRLRDALTIHAPAHSSSAQVQTSEVEDQLAELHRKYRIMEVSGDDSQTHRLS